MPYSRDSHGLHFVYVLECNNNSIYVGTTRNVYNRMCAHFSLNRKNRTPATIRSKPIRVRSVYEGGYYEEAALACQLRKKLTDISVFGGHSRLKIPDTCRVSQELVPIPTLADDLNQFILDFPKKSTPEKISSSQRGIWLKRQKDIVFSNPRLFHNHE